MLLLGSLSGGGAERVAVNLMNRCDPLAVDLRLGLLRRAGRYLDEVDPCRIVEPRIARTGAPAALRAPADIAGMVRSVRPQVLMSFGMGLNMLSWLALRGLGGHRPAWICREDSNADAEIAALTTGRLGRAAVRAAIAHVYRAADARLAVSRDLASRLERGFALPDGGTRVIHNPIDLARIARSAARPLASAPERPFIVTAGRLTHQKGHDLLIDAFAASAAARPMDLVILGEGPLEGALRARAARLGVEGRVMFPGFQANPWAWFARARLFVLPSRWEGFGNVVAEALACGVPTLVTDCDFGPREQVAHGQSGWVVAASDGAALGVGLERLIADDALASRLAAGGRVRAGAFDIDAIARTYADFFVENAAVFAEPVRPAPRETDGRWPRHAAAAPARPAA